MTIPNAGFIPGGQQPVRGPNGYVQAGPGYDAATAQAQAQAQAQPGQQQQFQHPTQLGMPALQAFQPGMLGSDPQSPLSMVPPNVSTQGQRPQQVQQPPAQYNPNQPYQYNQPQQQPQPQNVDPLTVPIYDPRLPPELQGKSYAQLAQMNNGLRSLHLQSATAQPTVSPTSTAASASTAASQAGAAPVAPTFNWAKPDESIGKIVEDKVGALLDSKLGPVVQQGQMSQAQQARNTVAGEIPNFAAIEPYVLQRMNGMSPSDLTNVETWRVAARVAIGDLAIAAHNNQHRGHVQQQPQQVPQYQGVYQQPQYVPQGSQPLPNINGFQTFFTEQSNQGGPGPQGVALSPAQRNAAAAMGMSEADYVAWGAGVPSQNRGVGR